MHQQQLSPEEHFYKLDNMVLSSYPILRKTFETRWKKESGMEWQHDPKQGQSFIKVLGASAYQKADRIQKSLITKGVLEDWDLSLLSLAIQHLGSQISYKCENESVRQLTDLRNELAHNTKRKITPVEYGVKVTIFKHSLKGLGVKEHEIEEMITKAGSTSSKVARKMAIGLNEKAKKFMKKNKFGQAIECYEEAMSLPSLLPIDQAITYEHRADVYLKFAEFKRKSQERHEANMYCDQAIQDGIAALKRNDYSWKAHFTIGKCFHFKTDLANALKHFTKAVAISPSQKQLKIELDSCKADFTLQSSSDHLNSALLPLTITEGVTKYEEDTGHKLTQNQFLLKWKRTSGLEGITVPGQDDFVRGLQFISGWGETQNDAEAVRWFTKAVEAGNPEAMHSLGLCYYNGTGVGREPSKAYKVFLQAAQMSPDTPGRTTAREKNLGVTQAQFNLGLQFQHGIGVEQDYSEAIKWYEMAANNGDTYAPNSLAIMSIKGIGMWRNEKMAEYWWHQAVHFKDTYAALSLKKYYVEMLEPERAEVMFKAAMKLRNPALNERSEAEFNVELEQVVFVRDQYKPGVVAFEEEHGLSAKGLTFLERLRRKMMSEEPTLEILSEVLNKVWEKQEHVEVEQEANVLEIADFKKIVREKANKGSVTATVILETLQISDRLIRFVQGKDSFTARQKTEIINMLYECATREFSVVRFPPEIRSKLKELVAELVNSKCGRKSEEDMQLRVIYVRLNCKPSSGSENNTFAVELLQKGLGWYPNNLFLYELLCLYERDWHCGLSHISSGLERFPDNVNLLYYKAQFMRNTLPTGRMSNKVAYLKHNSVKDAYQNFLNKAPEDHRKVPEAYYGLAMMLMMMTNDENKIEEYYRLGKESEEKRLPCYLADANSSDKKLVEAMFLVAKLDIDDNDEVVCKPQPTALKESKSRQDERRARQRKAYLDNPLRREVLNNHRQDINKDRGTQKMKLSDATNADPKPNLKLIHKMFNVKPITIKEMNPIETHTYDGRMLQVTLIEDPNPYCDCIAIHLVGEDENGDVVCVNVTNLEKNKENLGKFAFGTKLGILKPHMRIVKLQAANDIMVDDHDSIIYLGRVKNMCRFCMDPVHTKKLQMCGKCKRAVYCSKECQENDWKFMKHSLIC
ncbi:unnamed protein product [Orchesella dallaii]|uniref:MYND-type domain-containing protein n=1 Tax=Orchesella dallaii TaxID=48710 RepID=A0ABP1RAT9_9HEXA